MRVWRKQGYRDVFFRLGVWRVFVIVSMSPLAIACGSGSGEFAGVNSYALGDFQPLDRVGLSEVQSAAPSCEGRLEGVSDFALLGESGLVVGLDEEGEAVCVDAVESVEEELNEQGRSEEALRLGERYRLSTGMHSAREAKSTKVRKPIRGGDPGPEPNGRQLRRGSRNGGV